MRRVLAVLGITCCAGIACSLFPLGTQAQINRDEFNSFLRAQDSLFTQFTDSVTNEYDSFARQQLVEFEQFKKEIDRLWDDALYPSAKDYVEYRNDFHARFHVDFEKGDVKASVLVDDLSRAGAFEKAKAEILEQIQEAVQSAGQRDPYRLASDTSSVAGPRILHDQVVDKSGRGVNAARAAQYARDVVSSSGISVDTVVSKDGFKRIKLTAVFNLVPDHVKRRAKQYLPYASQYSKQYHLDLRLVLAIMHTESYFNPRATSRIPAFGLMQLVPGTAGREAYNKVYGQDRLLTPDYLYDPQNNIELGCAYLNLLRFTYLKDLEGDQEAYPCVIASYNGGIGTVCRALTGTKNLDNIGRAAKGKSSDELIRHLGRKLPYEETRNYLTNVLQRMALYDEWAR